MNRLIVKIKSNKKMVIGLLVLFTVALVLNAWTPYASDDYSYMYSFSDGSRLTSFFDIFPSLSSHYMQYGNGRLVPHFFVMLFLIGSKWIFNLANTIVFVMIVLFIYQLTSRKKEHSILLLFAIPTLLWIYLPAYGQIFLWLDGAINYSWCYLFALLFLSFYLSLFRNRDKLLSLGWKIFLCIFAFLFGNYSENVSFSVIFVAFALLCIVIYQEHNIRKYLYYVFPIICGALGYLLLLASPAGGAKITSNLSLSALFKNAIEIFTTYYNICKVPLIIFFILLVIAIYYKIDKNEILLATAFFAISVISSSMLIAASYLTERNMANSMLFLLIAIVQLLQLIRCYSRLECLSLCICVYLIVSSLMSYWDGCYDIYRVYKEQAARDSFIASELEAGNMVVGVPIITSTTKYCCKYGLLDLRAQGADDPWPNNVIAKYYGLDEIYVIYPD